ncbi:MAG: hypothetical protein AB3N64_13250 [Puniceicoccaceae bacterium]
MGSIDAQFWATGRMWLPDSSSTNSLIPIIGHIIMHRKIFLLLLLTNCSLITLSEAATDILFAIKEQVFEQNGNNLAFAPQAYRFFAGAEGDGDLTALTVTYPGSGGPFPVPGSPGEFGLESPDYATIEELNAVYPNGDITFSLTDNGSTQDLGPFSISGDAYPVTPNISNALEFQDSDYSQDFQLNWNAFFGAGDEDRILLQIWDNQADSELISSGFLDATATSFTIPGGTLSVDRYYDIELLFINSSTGATNPQTVVGYLTTTRVLLSTHTSDTRLSLYKWRAQQQLSSTGDYTDPNYRFLSVVTGASKTVAGASLDTPVSDILASYFPFGENAYILASPFGPKETLDTTYPAGEYTFIVTEDSVNTAYGPFNLPGDDYPSNPQIINFAELQTIDPSESQTITWDSTPIGVSFIEVFVLDGDNNRIWYESFGPGFTTTQLPANTISLEGTYRLVIRYWAPKVTNERPPTALGYLSSTNMALGTSQGGGDPVIELAYVVKTQNFSQEGSAAPQAPYSWSMNAGLSGSDNIVSASFVHPSGTDVLDGFEGEYDLDGMDYGSQSELDSVYPDGEFDLLVSTGGPSQSLGPFQITGSAYPNAPHIQNALDLETHDLTQDFELTWNAFSSADEFDEILVEVYDETLDEGVIFERLAPTATSFVIPGNQLQPDRYYEIIVLFVNRVDALDSPEAIIGYLSVTEFRLSTHTSDTDILFYKRHQLEQTGVDQLEDLGYAQLVFVRGNSRSVDYGELFTPLSITPLINTAPNTLILAPGFGPKEVMDADYPAGEYGIGLNEDGQYTYYGPYVLSEDAYPEAPLFQNFSELQNVDASQEQQINWSASPDGVGAVTLQIRDASFRVIWSETLPPEATGTVIPASTLSKSSSYRFSLQFWVESSGSEMPDASVGYGTITRINVQTLPYSAAYASWLTQYFSAEQIADLAIVGEMVDYDGDKLNNYFEFLAQFDPTDNTSTLTVDFSFGVSDMLRVSPLAVGLPLEVQSSTNLVDWNPVGAESYEIIGEELQLDLQPFLPDTFFRIVLTE